MGVDGNALRREDLEEEIYFIQFLSNCLPACFKVSFTIYILAGNVLT